VALVAVGFLLGILAVQQLATLPSPWWGLLVFPFLFLALRRPWWWTVVFLIAGIAWASLRAGAILAEELPPALEGQDLVFEGTVADIPQAADYGLRFEFDVVRAEHLGNVVSVPARVLLTRRGEDVALHAGQTWRLTARLTRPHGFQNPGGFDYEGFLFRARLRARGYVRDVPAPQLLREATPGYAVNAVRERLGVAMRAAIGPAATAPIVVALANGDARGVSEAQWEVFRRSGTLHLVAISGLHITLVAAVVFFGVRRAWAWPAWTVLWVPAPLAGAVAGLLAAAGYAALAGFVVPTQRALIMLAVALGAKLLRRRIAPFTLLGAALFAVLVYDPLAVMAAGFWLSFAAVAVIVWLTQCDDAAAAPWRRWTAIQWAVAVGMLPLMLAWFQQVSLVAPLANLVAIPVFDFAVVPLTLAGIVAQPLSAWFAAQCYSLAATLLAWLWPLLEWLAHLDWAVWRQHEPPVWAVVCGLVGVLVLLAPRGWPARWVGALWLAPLVLIRPPAPPAGELWFTLLDVGQGLAAVVRTQHHALVFDTGAKFSSRFDAGSAVVVPYLQARGVRTIDMLVVSHGDNDHIGGAAALLTQMPVTRRLSSVPERLPGAAPCVAGDAWIWDGVRFEMLNPPAGHAGADNNASCVLKIDSAHGSVLLTADIEARAERALLARDPGRLTADILVAPHHGSKTSSSCAFIDAVRPRVVLFPAGYRNRYHHPHPRVRERYAVRGIAQYESAHTGAMEFRLSGAGIAPMFYREQARRYWFARDNPPQS
jgi:competence protein ComEC